MRRYPVYDSNGAPRPETFDEYPTIGSIGDYEVRVTAPPREFVVLCPPAMRAPGRWNVTAFTLEENGLLEPRDADVVLDPYHMCLLYQLVEEHRNARET